MSDNDTKIAQLRELAKDRGDRFREKYSGRGMYGRTCVGIVTDSPEDVIADAGIRGAHTDDMGLSTIVYWPSLSLDKPEPKEA